MTRQACIPDGQARPAVHPLKSVPSRPGLAAQALQGSLQDFIVRLSRVESNILPLVSFPCSTGSVVRGLIVLAIAGQ